MSYSDPHGVAWVAAVLAPWAVSPHPNFSNRDVSGPGRLALVTERRYAREQERDSAPDNAISDLETRLVEQAEASLVEGTQVSAVNQLWGLARNSALVLGARAAAALYASVGDSELERSATAIENVLALADDVRDTLAGAEREPEGVHIILAALLQQVMLRRLDSNDLSPARAGLNELRELTRPEPSLAEFEVSAGIRWRSRRVQADILATIRKNVLRAETHLEFPTTDAWVDLVRSAPTWIDTRASWIAADRDSQRVRDDFETIFDATSGKRILMRSSPIDAGYAALLVAELGGDLGAARSARESLGKLVLMAADGDSGRVREGLRLLRQSRSESPLKSALDWVRDFGPTAALTADARAVIERGTREGWIVSSDLACLAAAADSLGDSGRRSAIEVAFRALETPQLRGHGGWSLHDQTWRAVASLIGDSGADDIVARRLTSYLDEPGMLTEPLTRTLARAARQIKWEATDPSIRARWSDWTLGAEDRAEMRELQEVIRSTLLRVESVPRGLTMERAALIADTEQADPLEVERIGVFLVARLNDEAAAARSGTMSFGGYTTSNVAAAFVLRHNQADLWEALLQFMMAPEIDAVLKAQAADRLARAARTLPEWVRARLADGAVDLLASKQEAHFFAHRENLGVFPEAVRLALAVEAMNTRAGIAAVMALMTSSVVGRVEAARTIPYVHAVDPTWAHSLLLVLSQDGHPSVRAEAAGALILVSSRPSALSDAVDDCIDEMFEADGMRIPAVMLAAVQRLRRESPEAGARFRTEIARLINSSNSRLVVDGARDTEGLLDKG